MGNNVKISELPKREILNGNELVPFADEGANGAFKTDLLKEYAAQDAIAEAERMVEEERNRALGAEETLNTAITAEAARVESVESEVAEIQSEVDEITESKADKATTLAGYGIIDALAKGDISLKGLLAIPAIYNDISTNGITEVYRKTDIEYLPNIAMTLKSIKFGSFFSCAQLRLVYMPSTITPDFEMFILFKNCSSLEEVYFKEMHGYGECSDAFAFDTALRSIYADVVFNNSVSNLNGFFSECTSLTTLKGVWQNIRLNFSAYYSPLTRESALVLINGLSSEVTGKTLTLSSYTKALLTDEDKALVTSKGWTLA